MKYFSYSNEDGFTKHATEHQARAHAHMDLKNCASAAPVVDKHDLTWVYDPTAVCWGEIKGQGKLVDGKMQLCELPAENPIEGNFQQRVLLEKAALDDKLTKLNLFLRSPESMVVPLVERTRLHKQMQAMFTYSKILEARIADFKTA